MSQLSLFPEFAPQAPETEGIKYAGSKQKLIPEILRLIFSLKPKSVFDGFAGTTRVTQALAKSGYRVLTNDLSLWSQTFSTCYLLNKKDRSHFQKIIHHLNSLPGKRGWFSENYGGSGDLPPGAGPDGLKKPWQLHNTERLDSIRDEIDSITNDPTEKAVLLTSLIYALDKVDSTLGHFVSYLKDWSPRSFNNMILEVPNLLPFQEGSAVFQEDVLSLAPRIECDLAYYDPPYGSNNEKMPPSRVRYASYYHIWTTIIKNDKPALVGKAKRRFDVSDDTCSVFEEFRKDNDGHFIALKAIEQLIRSTNAPYIVFSYNSGGRATAAELLEIMKREGELLEVRDIEHKKNVMAGMRWTNEWVREVEESNKEFLFLLKKK